MDAQALRLLGYGQLSGERDPAELSVLKLLGSVAVQAASLRALEERGPEGLVHPAVTGPYNHMNNDAFITSWFERFARSFTAAGTLALGQAFGIDPRRLANVICHGSRLPASRWKGSPPPAARWTA